MRHLVLCALALLFFESAVHSQTPRTLSVPADSPRWDLQGQAKAAEYQGRKCLFLDGGAAVLNDLEMRDAVVRCGCRNPRKPRVFSVFSFRIATTAPTPNGFISASTSPGFLTPCSIRRFLNTGLNWQIYNGPGFTGAVDIPKDVWFHLRLEVVGAQAKFYVRTWISPRS